MINIKAGKSFRLGFLKLVEEVVCSCIWYRLFFYSFCLRSSNTSDISPLETKPNILQILSWWELIPNCSQQGAILCGWVPFRLPSLPCSKISLHLRSIHIFDKVLRFCRQKSIYKVSECFSLWCTHKYFFYNLHCFFSFSSFWMEKAYLLPPAIVWP